VKLPCYAYIRVVIAAEEKLCCPQSVLIQQVLEGHVYDYASSALVNAGFVCTRTDAHSLPKTKCCLPIEYVQMSHLQ